MVQRIDEHGAGPGSPRDPSDEDDRVGEAVEAFLTLAAQGQPPAIDEFVARYPDLEHDVRAALEGLELVHGLLGIGSATGSGSSRGTGLDHRIESGRRIAGYRVVRELGRGGMGTVYEAVHMGLDRPVALKVLNVHVAPDSSARRRFLNEARTAAGLHHTHIVPVFDVGQVGGLCYYAMQRIEGSGLDRVLRYLRRACTAGSTGCVSLAGSRPATEDGPATSASSLFHSRLGQLWSRLSSQWLSRHPRFLPGMGTAGAGPGALRSLPLPSLPDRGQDALVSRGDSTASWDTAAGRESPLPARCAGENGSSSPAGPDAFTARPAIEPDAPARGDELPPFGPPRGSAYFRWVAEVGIQSADALSHAHHQGVIHRDVKPSNLLIDARGNIWVTDFGLARRLADPGLTHHDSLLGTPRYMSPEQARTGAIDGRTDVYSLGATLYELLTLRPPFDGRTAAELIDQIGRVEPPSPRAIDPRVPRDLETIVLKALSKRPADRYETAAELARDLVRFLNREPVKARRISPAGRLWRVARRHPGITAVSTAAAAAILAIATYAHLRVVVERNETRKAFNREKEANRKERAARKEKLLPIVELVGLSGTPNRRSHGLALIGEAAELEPEAELRSRLRDEAVKFLVLREVEAHQPELPTARAHGIVFGPTGHRLAVLSEDGEELMFWDVEHHHRQNTVSLRAGPGGGPLLPEPFAGELPGGSRITTGQNDASVSPSNRNAPGSSTSSTLGRPATNRLASQRLVQLGQSIAAVLPDERGVALIDLVPGAPPRILSRPDHAVLSVAGDPGGTRLVTIEQVLDESTAGLDGLSSADVFTASADLIVNLWDPEHLDRPIKTLEWARPAPPGRLGWPQMPLVSVSPDGRMVAVAAFRGKSVTFFSGFDGKPLRRGDGRGESRTPSRTDPRGERRYEIDTQTDLSALAFGPDESLGTAGTTAGGVVIKIWNLANPRVPTSLTPFNQSFTRLMRFSPQGTLLAIAGVGPIELWDPIARSLVAVLTTNDQPTDVAFAPDGRTLAAAGRTEGTFVWTVHDSAARTQLSGFDSTPASLAFSDDGWLAGSGWRGDVWFWKSGRCPELGPPAPQPPMSAPSPIVEREQPRRPDSTGRSGMREVERDRARDALPPISILAFDAQSRLVAHDAQGVRIWPARSSSVQTLPVFKQALPRITARGWFMILTASTSDARKMALVRASDIFLWNAESPDQVTQVTPPPGWETALPSVANKASRPAGITAAESSPPSFRAVQIAPGGGRLYLLEQGPSPGQGRANPLHVWDLVSRFEASRIEAHEVRWDPRLTEGAISIALRGDGALLAVGDRKGTVSLIDTRTRRLAGKIDRLSTGDSESFLLAMAFSPDGESLAIGSTVGTISLWSVADPSRPSPRIHLPGHRGITNHLVFDTHGRRLASAGLSDPLIEIWDLDLINRELARLGLAE
jgi:WD40 repeat protein